MSESGYTKKTTDWLGRPKEEHFDEHGHKIGETRVEKDWLGRDVQVHTDESGSKVGETRRGQDWLGRDRAEHYDTSGQRTGHSRNDTDWIGRPIQRHFDETGAQVGVTRKSTDWLGRPQKEHEGRFFKPTSAPASGTKLADDREGSWADGGYGGAAASAVTTGATAAPRRSWGLLAWIVVAGLAFGTWAALKTSVGPVPYERVTPVRGHVDGVNVNLRSDPMIQAPRLAAISRGDTVFITGLRDGWYSVSLSDGRRGYIYGLHVRPERGPSYAVGEFRQSAVLVISPGSARAITRVRQGDRVVILGSRNEWLEVATPWKRGWIQANFVIVR